ncbi:hypothetical protein ACWGI0_06990 [Streptomyces sp. NPDC054802]
MHAEEIGNHDGREAGDRFDHGGVAGGEDGQAVLIQQIVGADHAPWPARGLAWEEVAVSVAELLAHP